MLIMKTLSKLNLLFAIAVILWGCANDDNLQAVSYTHLKGLITAFFLLLGICPATEVAAQRDLHRQLSLHMQAGTVDGLSVCSRYGEYALSLINI